ncbi:MAG: hypothetical protein MZV70_37505 [Desulfobacterales bacterium]|nr:hypothetical protein [Desulfobacterales bacterium]
MKRIGKYIVRGLLGRGGMSKVYKVEIPPDRENRRPQTARSPPAADAPDRCGTRSAICFFPRP